MKIAYVTTYDVRNIHAWSGLGFYISKALELSGFQIEYVGMLRNKMSFWTDRKRSVYRKLTGKYYDKDRDPLVLKSYARQIRNALTGIAPDVVFSPGTTPIAYLRTDRPIVFWTDATFAGMVGFYPQFSNYCKETVRDGNRMEQLALSNCRLAVYASDWAANSAIKNYHVDPDKVKVVPFGPNIDCDNNVRDINNIVDKKDFSICKLLFIGVDWIRKGGDTSLGIAEELNQQGMPTELHIVGCNPQLNLPNFVRVHGFISKTTKEGLHRLYNLFTESHFFILPSLAECYGIVFAEANSFGLPVLATDVGGIPTIIRDGKNGKMFKIKEDPREYCRYIVRLMSSKEDYKRLALSSFREYSERLNWSSAGKKVCSLIREFCG